MGRKVNLTSLFILGLFVLGALIIYFPIFLGKVPFNGNLLVVHFSPWRYEQWPGFPTGVPFKFMGVDEIREFYPPLELAYSAFQNRTLPLWNPYNFSGYPNLANWASAVFYPLHMMMLFLDKVQMFIFLKLSAIVLSGVFTYLYLRALFLNRRASLFGGVSFAFSSTMLVWGAEIWQSVHSFLWLPLILFAIERYINIKKPLYLLLGSFGIAASIMAGYIQPTIYILIFTFFYIAFRIIQTSNYRAILPFIIYFILGLGISAIHTMPGVEAFLLSPRRGLELTELNLSFLLPLEQLVTLFVPDFFGHIATQNWFAKGPGQYYEHMIYIGILPLTFSFLSLHFIKLRPFVIFFLVAGMLSLLTTLNLPTSRLIYELHIPFLSTAIPIRTIFITVFSVSILSAFGLASWFGCNKKERRRFLNSLIPILIIYITIGLWLVSGYVNKVLIPGFPPEWHTISIRNFVIPAAFFSFAILFIIIGILFKNLRKYLYILLVILLFTNSLQFARKYIAFSQVSFFYPKSNLLSFIKEKTQEQSDYGRYFGYGEAALANNLATVYHIYSPEGYDPVNIKTYNELISSVNTGDFRGIASRSDALIPSSDINPQEDENIFRLKLLDLLGVKFVGYYKKVEMSRNLSNSRFTPIWEDKNFVIYENKKAFKRVFLVPEVIRASTKEEAIRLVYDENVDLSKNVILQEPFEDSLSKEASGAAIITNYSPNNITIEVWTTAPQFLVLSDAYYPGWKATVNGNPTKIYQANHALRAIFLPKGENNVIFTYKPLSFIYGGLITGISVLMGIAIVFIDRLRLKRL